MTGMGLWAAIVAVAAPGAAGPSGEGLQPCWSAWRVDVEAKLVITVARPADGTRGITAAADAPASGFEGRGWTAGNLFDDIDDLAAGIGPVGPIGAEGAPPISLDGSVSFAGLAALPVR
jgi:hypothetical protein